MSSPLTITSPISKTNNVVFLKKIDSREIIKLYREILEIDVSEYFREVSAVQIYQCLDTGYKFYYPFNLEGDSQLYEQLSLIPRFYLDWKWDYEVAEKLIEAGSSVLEIGSGKGAFIEYLHKKGIDSTGLEINRQSLAEAKEKGLNLISQTIQEHAAEKPGYYDVVCYFQVLEHIADVHGFVEASIKALKVGGKLIVCVPNNDSFIKYDKFLPTNMPPHHLGLWNQESLENLQGYFNIKLKSMYFQKLTEQWEFEWYYRTQLSRLINISGEGALLSKIIYKTSSFLPFLKIIKILGKYINNHSILAVYEKEK